MNMKQVRNKPAEEGSKFFLHGSDMLKYAFEKETEWNKSLLNVSAFQSNINDLLSDAVNAQKNSDNYIVVDFAQTAMKYLDQNPLNNGKLENTNWQQDMDDYIESLIRYFCNDNIILVRVVIPKIRANYTIIRPFYSDYIDNLMILIKQFEDYFIQKVNPYVIDISKHYFLENDHPYAGTYLCFEEFYNQDLRNNISYIIANTPKQREFATQNYEYTLRRFIKVYDNLYDKQMLFTLLNKNDIVDFIVIHLNRRIIENNIEALVKLKQGHYTSYDEVIQNHDFEGNDELKTIVILVCRVLNQDILNPNIDYSPLYQEMLPARKPLAMQVNKKLTELGFIEGKVVTIFNVEIYHRALNLYVNRQYKKAFQLLLQAYNNATQPIFVDDWGSCISRVPMNLDYGKYKVNKFINRCCFLNEFDEPIDVSNIDFLDSYFGDTWYNRCFRDSLEKNSKNRIRESKSTWLVVDFFDTINELAVFRNAIIDFSEDNRNSMILKNVLHECVPFSFYDKPDEYIKERMDLFIDFVKEKYGDQIILVNLVIREHYLDGRRQVKTLDVVDLEQKNAFVEKWQKYFFEQTGGYCIDLAKYFLADDLSIYGASIVHYEEGFNQEVYRYIDHIIQTKPEQKLYDDYAKAIKVDRLIEFKSQHTDLSYIEPLFQYSDDDKALFRLSLEELQALKEKERLYYPYRKNYTIR